MIVFLGPFWSFYLKLLSNPPALDLLTSLTCAHRIPEIDVPVLGMSTRTKVCEVLPLTETPPSLLIYRFSKSRNILGGLLLFLHTTLRNLLSLFSCYPPEWYGRRFHIPRSFCFLVQYYHILITFSLPKP